MLRRRLSLGHDVDTADDVVPLRLTRVRTETARKVVAATRRCFRPHMPAPAHGAAHLRKEASNLAPPTTSRALCANWRALAALLRGKESSRNQTSRPRDFYLLLPWARRRQIHELHSRDSPFLSQGVARCSHVGDGHGGGGAAGTHPSHCNVASLAAATEPYRWRLQVSTNTSISCPMRTFDGNATRAVSRAMRARS